MMVVLSNEGKGHRLLRFEVTLPNSLVKTQDSRYSKRARNFAAEKAGRRRK